jgi:hypothetical protein
LSQTASFEEPIDTSSRFKEQRLPDGIRPRWSSNMLRQDPGLPFGKKDWKTIPAATWTLGVVKTQNPLTRPIPIL